MVPPAQPPPTAAPGSSGAPVGRLLGGRYELLSLAGKGAMGRVWAAHDQVLNRTVAIKEVDLPRGMPASEADQVAQRTMREARAIASVSDPHVVTIFDMLVLPHGPAIVMELLAARSLAELLAVDGPMPETEATTVGLAVASGLLAAHSAGITHRDVKPGNVLMCLDGRIKLTDFGIARSAGEQTITATGLLLGSPAYISPEVASGAPATPRSDAWGLGALLFACVEGGPPFDRGSPMATLTAVIQDPVPEHPHSGRLTGIIRGLLTKDPATRMTVAVARDALQRVLGEAAPTPVRWRPPPAARPVADSSGTAVPPSSRTAVPRTRTAAPFPRTAAPPPPWTAAPPPRTAAPFPRTAAPPPRTAAPPPPWEGAGAAALRPIPVRAPQRSRGRKAALTVMAGLLAVLAALAGFLGVRTVAHLENGTPVVPWSAPARG